MLFWKQKKDSVIVNYLAKYIAMIYAVFLFTLLFYFM